MSFKVTKSKFNKWNILKDVSMCACTHEWSTDLFWVFDDLASLKEIWPFSLQWLCRHSTIPTNKIPNSHIAKADGLALFVRKIQNNELLFLNSDPVDVCSHHCVDNILMSNYFSIMITLSEPSVWASTMQNRSDSSGEAPLVILENLYPAILQSFAVILLGYGTSRWNFIPASQCRGFSRYISHFALPALLFQKMATLSFGSVDWLFWTSILVAKGMMFILVFGLTLIVGMPRRLGTAAIFSMFATQSNDFALGYPICELP